MNRYTIALAACLLLPACTTTTVSGVTNTACTTFHPITWSSNDTDMTIRQVKAHNAAWDAICKKQAGRRAGGRKEVNWVVSQFAETSWLTNKEPSARRRR